MSKYIGACVKGEPFQFSYDARDDLGHSLAEDSVGFVPTHYDIFRTTAGPVLSNVITDAALSVDSRYETLGKIRFLSVATTAAAFVAGEMYTLVLKDDDGAPSDGADQYKVFMFRLEHPVARRLTWLRNDIENALNIRLKRLLALEGENILLDMYDEDNAGNIISLRIRIFDTAAAAKAATIDIGDSELPEPGELESYYDVTQTHTLPRSTRDSHLSAANVDFDDADMNSNQESEHTPAPGNASGDEADVWDT